MIAEDVSVERADKVTLLTIYQRRMLDLFYLVRVSFQPNGHGVERQPEEKASRSCLHLRLGPIVIAYLRFMVAPLRRLYSWGVPSNEIVRLLQAFVRDFGGSELVELGAGTGYWSFVLARDGLLASSYDLTPCHYSELNGHHYISRSVNAPAFVAVNQGYPISLKNLPRQPVLLLCWPPTEDSSHHHVSFMASTSLQCFRGDSLVYVGEGVRSKVRCKYSSGAAARSSPPVTSATAGISFHNTIKTDWTAKTAWINPRWPGSADEITILQRKYQKPIYATSNDICTNVQLTISDSKVSLSAAFCFSADEVENSSVSESEHFSLSSRQLILQNLNTGWNENATVCIYNRVCSGGLRLQRGLEYDVIKCTKKYFRLLRMSL